jgi:hypothetical protein
MKTQIVPPPLRKRLLFVPRVLLCLGLLAGLLVPGVRASVVAYSKVITSTAKTIDNTPGYSMIVVCSAGPFTVQAGDLVSAHIQEELTWTGTSHVMAGCGIVVATSPTATDSTSPGYLGMLSKFSGSNLDASPETTEILARNGSYQFTSASSTVYINSVAYGATLGGTCPDFVIPAGYAELVAVVERGVTRYTTTAYQQLPYDSGLKMYYVPTGGAQLVQYSLGPINVPADTMVDVRFQIEGTTETDFGTGQRLGRKIISTTSPTATVGTFMSVPIQGGATRTEHHFTYGHGAGQHFPSADSNAYFNTVLWSYNGTLPQVYVESDTTLYGGYAVELRPFVGFWRDATRNVATLDGAQRVLYSIGPINIPAGQVAEVRYQAAFAPTANVAFDSMIVRGTSATAVTGTTVQRALYRKYDPSYVYTNAVHSTAEQVTTAQTGQYYNVVAWLPNGGSLPVMDWGQLEVVFR